MLRERCSQRRGRVARARTEGRVSARPGLLRSLSPYRLETPTRERTAIASYRRQSRCYVATRTFRHNPSVPYRTAGRGGAQHGAHIRPSSVAARPRATSHTPSPRCARRYAVGTSRAALAGATMVVVLAPASRTRDAMEVACEQVLTMWTSRVRAAILRSGRNVRETSDPHGGHWPRQFTYVRFGPVESLLSRRGDATTTGERLVQRNLQASTIGASARARGRVLLWLLGLDT